MRERENWDVLCEVCDKTIERGVATELGDNYCDSCYDELAYENTTKIKGFLEDYDGLIVLSDIRNFKDEKEFVEQAEKYILENRGHRIPVLQPQVTDIIINEEEWKPADDPDIEGERITVYCSDLDWENSEEN